MKFEGLILILIHTFNKKYVESLLSHFREAVDGFNLENWDTALSSSGKFVEATLKALYHYTDFEVPPDHKFKVGHVIQTLERTDSSYDRSIRITIPRACRFVYDVASNRGARHDSVDFVPNRMDANVVVPVISWILAEMVRLSKGESSIEKSGRLIIDRITETKHPIFESIDERTYVNYSGLKPKEIAILLLYEKHPGRIRRHDLVSQIKVNNRDASLSGINTALTRIKDKVDVNDDGWMLRRIGIDEAEKLVNSLYNGVF